MRKVARTGQLNNGWSKTLEAAGKDERESILKEVPWEREAVLFPLTWR